MKNNPKSHDALFKWLIASFTEEFFAHYFPGIRIGKYSFIEKEFISRYEALKESLKGDLFLIMEVEADGQLRELAIQIEHQSGSDDVSGRMFEYLCYVWLMKKKPVWSIVVYTDEAKRKKKVPDKFCYAFCRENSRQLFQFDVIKVNQEKSGDLIRKHSLLCKLLALKADDDGTDLESLLHEIYRAVADMKDELSNDRLLLVNQWTDFYKKTSDETLRKIRKEVGMELIETTISEHIRNQGKIEGKREGKIEGKREGKIEGKIEGISEQIAILESLHKQGILSKKKKEQMLIPLRQKLNELYEQMPKAA
jgi:predicted transposase YdaD